MTHISDIGTAIWTGHHTDCVAWDALLSMYISGRIGEVQSPVVTFYEYLTPLIV